MSTAQARACEAIYYLNRWDVRLCAERGCATGRAWNDDDCKCRGCNRHFCKEHLVWDYPPRCFRCDEDGAV